MTSDLSRFDGLWQDVLSVLGPLSPEQLTNKPQPCPNCGGKDRYRFDDLGGSGSWFCNQCGGKDGRGGGGSPVDLLMRLHGWDFLTAVKRIEERFDSARPSSTTPRIVAITPRPSRAETPPLGVDPPTLGKASAQYAYTSADGQPLFWIQRIDKADGGKLFVHRTWVDGAWHYPRKTDGFDSAWPTPRPLYRLSSLARQPYADVLIVEGEKAADAAALLLTEFAVVSWPNGSNAIDKADWSPLVGRFVKLFPDNDEPGRKAMTQLGRKLLDLGCQVETVAPPPSAPDGWDIADAIWTPAEAVDHVHGNRTIFAPAKASPPPPPPEESDRPFSLLGFAGDNYYYLSHSSGRIQPLTSSAHTSLNLCKLARVEYWRAAYPGRADGVSWLQAVSDLIHEQHEVGDFNPDLIRGRGAWRDRNRTVLHLGNRLVVDGAEQPLAVRIKDSRYHYQQASSLSAFHGLSPLSDAEAIKVLDLCDRFNWEIPASALLLSGWCLLAPICGVLPWRPHLWLTASAGTGKSAVLDKFVSQLLGDSQLTAQGSSTEAFVRQHLKTDALPVVMDEMESNLQNDKQRVQQILALARQASSETRAVQGRGSASGETQIYRIRSMFLLASIATAVKQGADDRRFTQITLRRPPTIDRAEESDRWQKLKHDLETILAEEFCARFQLRTYAMVPAIRESVAVCSAVAAKEFGSQAAGDQYGTLLAGAWHVMHSKPATAADAQGLIASANWTAYADNENVLGDEDSCLQEILQRHLRVQHENNPSMERTILELLNMCHMPATVTPLDAITVNDAADALGREGLRYREGRLYVSNTAKGVGRILRDTPWATNWGTILSRLPDAEKAGPVHFPGAGTMRSISLAWPIPNAEPPT